MKRATLRFLMSLFIAFLFTMGVSYLSVVGHESTHVQINTYFQTESEYSVEWTWRGLSGRTIVTGEFPSELKRDFAFLGHSVNEAVGYQLTPFFWSIHFAVWFIALNYAFKRQDEELIEK